MKGSDIKPFHCLVIDDDVFTIDLITNILHNMGAYRLSKVDGGEAALSHIRNTRNRPDIIICALATAKMDGIEFLRHLAEEQFSGGIILISTKGQRILRIAVQLAEAHRLNVLGFLRKLFMAGALLNMLSHFETLKEISLPLPLSVITPEALHTAIKRGQILPFFQPKVSVKTGKVIGVEALARWQHPELGFVPPGLFVPVAEKHNLIGLMTQEIVSKTFQQAAAWYEAGLTLPFAINLSALLLSDVDLPDRMENELGKAGIDPTNLTLEITESTLCENTSACLDTLLRFRLKGIHLSIDDFGTDHSTLEQLHKMPFSELKIDRVYVTGAAYNEEAHIFFQSVIMLAKELKLITVAEGVETQEDWDVCVKLECDVVQGYFIGRPVPGGKFFDAEYHPTVSRMPLRKATIPPVAA